MLRTHNFKARCLDNKGYRTYDLTVGKVYQIEWEEYDVFYCLFDDLGNRTSVRKDKFQRIEE